MKHVSIIVCSIGLMLPPLAAIENGSPARAAEVPAYFKPIVGTETATAAEIGTKNVLQLNTTMFELYGDAAQIFKKNILAQHPVILGLFSGAGGRFILYRPGMPPLEAPQVPIVYQLMKSVGHSTMALGEVVVPYINSPNDKTWRAFDGGVSHPHAVGARRPRCHAVAGRLEAEQPRDPAEQHCVHGRVPEEQRDHTARRGRNSPRSRVRS